MEREKENGSKRLINPFFDLFITSPFLYLVNFKSTIKLNIYSVSLVNEKTLGIYV